jgi:antitoxin component YwqK of YwqJK toxin-antitoxin module
MKTRKWVRASLIIFLVFLSTIFHSTTLRSQQIPKVIEFTRLHKIRSITTWTYYYHSGVLESSGHKDEVQIYDSSGNLIEVVAYSPSDAAVMLTLTYTYDGNHNQLTSTSLGALHQLDGSETDSYGSNGQMAEAKFRATDGALKTRCTFNYNDRGKLSKKSCYDATEQFAGGATYSYDPAGNLVEYTTLNADGSVGEKTTHSFNSQGNATETIVHDSLGSITSRTTYRYGDSENLIEQTDYHPDGSVRWQETDKYDSRGLRSEVLASSPTGPESLEKLAYEFFP